MSSVISIRVDDDIKEKLDKLADATQRSKSFLIAEAIQEYVVTQEWHIREIESGLEEAKTGKLARHDSVMKKLDRKLGNLLDKRRRA